MKPYHNLLREILDTNRYSLNRTATPTIKIPFWMMKFELMRGGTRVAPVVTTKKIHLPSVVHELIWFLSGDTNNNTLAANGVGIWNEWAVNDPPTQEIALSLGRRIEAYAYRSERPIHEVAEEFRREIDDLIRKENEGGDPIFPSDWEPIREETMHRVLDERGIPRATQVSILEPGELGPIYGRQWRNFPAGNFFWNLADDELLTYIQYMDSRQRHYLDSEAQEESGAYDLDQARATLSEIGIDQISQAITLLKLQPNSRRNIVTAWNPQVVPTDTVTVDGKVLKSAEAVRENVIRGRAALASCHTFFQFLTDQLTEEERMLQLPIKYFGGGDSGVAMPPIVALGKHIDEARVAGKLTEEQVALITETTPSPGHLLDMLNIPKYRLNLGFYCRSQDTFLGTPFNIASYGIFAHMVAQVVNMVPGTLTWIGGDVHLYTNHLDQVKTQLEREEYPAPELHLNPAIDNIFDFRYEDIEIRNYKHHGPLKGAVAV
jgi:thymidylate synthase